MIGTNPIAIGVPADPEPHGAGHGHRPGLDGQDPRPRQSRRADPAGLGAGREGDPTTDAAAAKKGAIAPFGGPKGYALGIAFEVLVASLAASRHRHRREGHTGFGACQQQGRSFHRHRPAPCRSGQGAGHGLSRTKSAPPRPPIPRIRCWRPATAPMPCAPNRIEGACLDDGLWDDLQKLARKPLPTSKGNNAMNGIFGALRLPASVVFGSGQRAAIGMMTAQIGKRALVCTDARMGAGCAVQGDCCGHSGQWRRGEGL